MKFDSSTDNVFIHTATNRIQHIPIDLSEIDGKLTYTILRANTFRSGIELKYKRTSTNEADDKKWGDFFGGIRR